MNVLFIAAESAPFVKVGGLADVIGALPHALQRQGHSIRVILPHHGSIVDEKFGIRPYLEFEMPWNEAATRVEVSHVEQGGVPFFFIRGWPFFAPGEPFVYHADEGIDVGRFLFLAAAALHFTRLQARRGEWRPDLVHAHDWHTAVVPFLLARAFPGDPLLSGLPTVFSIHNMQYQGWGLGWHLARAGLPPIDHGLLQAMGRADNTLAAGLAYSTMLSTVSPRYAQEITLPDGGAGLDGLLHARLSRLVGILNGIDTVRWNPAASGVIPAPFDADRLEQRVENKLWLQRKLGLPQQADVPLVGAVMRLVEQKGPGIMFPAVRYLLAQNAMQFVLLGTGHTHFETEAWGIGHDFPDRASIQLLFDEDLAEAIYAASDLFLMPSLFEPCGIGQMLAMRYGALPVVREVGGLADTVSPDVGFLFLNYDAGALQWALSRALDVVTHDPVGWQARQRRAMLHDFSWDESARQYGELYRRAAAIRQQYA